MEVHTLADLKRYLAVPGSKLILIKAPESMLSGKPHPWLNKVRGVEKLQTNAVKLEGGSWLEWRAGASEFSFHGDSFDVLDDNGAPFLTYKLIQ